MRLVSEIQNGSREELIAYLKSWGVTCHGTESDFELRLAAHKNFQIEGPGQKERAATTDIHEKQQRRRAALPH